MVMTVDQFLDRYGTDTSSNFQLLHWAKQLNIKPFYCIMCNELKKLKKLKAKNKNKYFIICNYQPTSEQGTHWTAMFKDENNSYFFDSYGIQIFPEAIDFLEEGVYSKFQIQPYNTTMCGELSLFILYKLSKGCDFFTTVLDMNEYFNK